MVELHFHDSEFTLLGKTPDEGSDDEATGADAPEESDGGGAVGALVALVVLVVVAFAVRRALGDTGDREGLAADVESAV